MLLARIADLYATHHTMVEVGEIVGLTYKEMRNIQSHWGLTSSEEARARAGRENSAKREAKNKATAARIQRVIAEYDCTVAEAGRRLGLSRDQAKAIAKRFSIRAKPAPKPPTPRAAPEPRAVFQPDFIPLRNPNLSPARQALVNAGKRAMWAASMAARKEVPQPKNADQLVAEAIAAGRVTRCPPMCAAPINNNRGF